MSISFLKFDSFVDKVVQGDFAAALLPPYADVWKIYLTDVVPDFTTCVVKADLPEIALGNGYAGPVDVQKTVSKVAGIIKVAGVDVTWLASGGPIGPFIAVVLFDATLPGEPLVGYWPVIVPITLQDGEDLKVDFAATILMVG